MRADPMPALKGLRGSGVLLEKLAKDLRRGAAVKGYRLGTHRLIAPGDTVTRVRPHMAMMGITRIANVTGLDRIGVPVVMVTRPNSRSIAVSQGKGLDLDSARASGLMEAVENWHAERIELPLRLGSLEDWHRRPAVADMDALPKVRGGRYHPGRTLLWIEAADLIGGGTRWLPYELAHTDFRVPYVTGSGCFPASTNGLASGNHMLEALCHAICEVVERDAVTLWNLRGAAERARTRIDLATVADPSCRSVITRLDDAQFRTAVWEVTSDIGIPSYYCLITDRQRPLAHSGAGAGCHPSRAVALLRALTEAVQVRTTYISGSRDDIGSHEYTTEAIAQKLRRADAMMAADSPQRRFEQAPDFEADSFAGDLEWLIGRLRAGGIGQLLVLDLSKPGLGLPVVKVVIPGLEDADDHPGYVAGARAMTASLVSA